MSVTVQQQKADSIRAACLSTACTSATVSTLQQLLRGNPPPTTTAKSTGKENDTNKGSRTATKQAVSSRKPSTAAKTTSRTKAKTATATVTIIEDKPPNAQLNQREKFALATEVFNSTLKSLSDAFKASPKPVSTTSRPHHQRTSSTSSNPRDKRTSFTRTPSETLHQRALQTTTNSPTRRDAPSLQRSSSHLSKDGEDGSPGNVVAAAECAREALAYLRGAESSTSRDAVQLQLEQGGLALIGKLLGHGLDELAARELRVEKRRLESCMLGRDKQGQIPKEEEKPGKELTEEREKLTLASLLDIKHLTLDNAALPLVITYLFHVLKLLASQRRPASIEAALRHLEPANTHALPHLISGLATSTKDRAKATQHFENLSRILLSLCPSVSSSADSAATNAKISPTPEATWKLEILAFEARLSWWSLAKHTGDVEKELWEPVAKCAAALLRRSTMEAEARYQSIFSGLERLKQELGAQGTRKISYSAGALRVLSAAAEQAGRISDAVRWTADLREWLADGKANNAQLAACDMKSAVLDVMTALRTPTPHANVWAKLGCKIKGLHGNLEGSSVDQDSLLFEVMALRKALTQWILLRSEDDSANFGSMRESFESCCNAVASVCHFLARYVGTAPEERDDVATRLRFGEKAALAKKAIKSLLDTVSLCAKGIRQHLTINWDVIDQTLRNCTTALKELEASTDNQVGSGEALSELSSHAVKISAIYWNWYVQRRKVANQTDPESLRALRRSVEMLRERGRAEKSTAGFVAKLERLAVELTASKAHEKSAECYIEAAQALIDNGALRTVSESAATRPLLEAWRARPDSICLARIMGGLESAHARLGNADKAFDGLVASPSCSSEEKAVLLEWVLVSVVDGRLSTSNWSSTFAQCKEILEIYKADTHPLRHRRVVVLLHRLSNRQHADSAEHDELLRLLTSTDTEVLELDRDIGLGAHKEHCFATLTIARAFSSPTPSMQSLKGSLLIWQQLLDDPDPLTEVDDLDYWIQQLQMISDFLAAKGEDYLRLPALKILERALELKRERVSDGLQLVHLQCQLSLQYLHLGYSGKAFSVLAKAQQLVESPGNNPVNVESQLHYHLARAQILLATGDIGECRATLMDAQLLSESDLGMHTILGLSRTTSCRIRCSRLLADASYTFGLLALEIGEVESALKYAKRAVKLNQRIWASMENKPVRPADTSASSTRRDAATDTDGETLANGVCNLSVTSASNGPSVLPVRSMTHDALNGPAFWSLVPSLCRAQILLSQTYAWLSIWQEAIYHCEQAERVAEAVESKSLIVEARCRLAEHWCRSDRLEKAEEILQKMSTAISKDELSMLLLLCERARICRVKGDSEQETGLLNRAMAILKRLMSTQRMSNIDRVLTDDEELERRLSSLHLEPPRKNKASKQTKLQITKTGKRSQNIKHSTECPDPTSLTDLLPLAALRDHIMRLKAKSLIFTEQLSKAGEIMQESSAVLGSSNERIETHLLDFQWLMANAMDEMSTDFTFNILPESTISFPALARHIRQGPRYRRQCIEDSSPALDKPKARSRSPRKKVTAGKAIEDGFVMSLRRARDCALSAGNAFLRASSNSTIHQVSRAIGESNLVLSAASAMNSSVKDTQCSFVAFYFDFPSIHGLHCEYATVRTETAAQTKGDMLTWPHLGPTESPTLRLPDVSSFQPDFIDLLPPSWTTVSLTLNDTHDELFICKYQASQPPFILRLPMARHKSRDVYEEVFDYEDGKKELREIIALSDFSTHNGRDMSVKGAKSEWWAEREALDARLGDLLQNIENIWLGGFKGIFAQQCKDSELLARLQKSLQKILDRHLPSRQGKKSKDSLLFDSRVLELFTGLGDPAPNDEEEQDLDEGLMDLLYFVVDILQFNGEKNAYDEIDFDSLVVETIDALKAYHQATGLPTFESPPHTILVLDKTLHSFPWESLPCLPGRSVSRLPSMESLRERLAAMYDQVAKRQSTSKDAIDFQEAPGFHASINGGTSILNPSGDLSGTQSALSPYVEQLPTSWTQCVGPVAGAAVNEKSLSTALSDSGVLLYFGHGSTAQYIRPRSVRKLSPIAAPSGDPSSTRATALLMGCSSAAITENGGFSPHGMVLAYLTAGAPSVVGCLWDVTDRDCDRFSVECGRRWGLWKAIEDPNVSKDVKKRGRKGKAKEDVENARDATILGHTHRRRVPSHVHGLGETRLANGSSGPGSGQSRGVSLTEAVAASRDACYLKYLNGAAMVVYGIPVYLDSY